jgi:hypothetical protein
MFRETGWVGHLQIDYKNLGCIGLFNEVTMSKDGVEYKTFSKDLTNPSGTPWFMLADPHVYAYNGDELWLCVTWKTLGMVEDGLISAEDVALTEWDNWWDQASLGGKNDPVNVIFDAKWRRSECLLEFDVELFDEVIKHWSDKHFERAKREPSDLEEKVAFWLHQK